MWRTLVRQRHSACRKTKIDFCTQFRRSSVFDSRAVTQAVNSRPFTPKAPVRARYSACGICGEQRGNGTDFSTRNSIYQINIIRLMIRESYSQQKAKRVISRDLPTKLMLFFIGNRETLRKKSNFTFFTLLEGLKELRNTKFLYLVCMCIYNVIR
jgi:hypothetical protein